MKPKIVIRADGGTSIGMGHVIRCLALADMLKDDFTIFFAIQEPTESVIKTIHSVTETILHLPITPDYNQDSINFSGFLDTSDIVVLDGYNFKTDYQKRIKNKGCKLVVIDDLHSWHHLADAIINHAAGVNESDYSKETYTKLYLGLNYALLRKAFLEQFSEARKITAIKKVFISMGAADINNLTHKFAEAISQVSGIEEIHMMLGSINPNLALIDALIKKKSSVNIVKHFDISASQLANLLKTCEIAICPASSISIEACSVGIGLISGFTAENQKGILQGLIDNKTVINWGDLNLITPESIIASLQKLLEHPNQLDTFIENQKKLIDGDSPKRLLKIVKDLTIEKIHFRFAKETDIDTYFKWTNDSLVRSNSYNQSEVSYKNHVKWFQSKLTSENCFLYFFLNEENVPVGQIRIEKGEKETVIGISIDSMHRGKGLASTMLKMASEDYLKKHTLEVITAYIKAENTSSYHSFLKAGFNDEILVTEQGVKSFKLFKKQVYND